MNSLKSLNPIKLIVVGHVDHGKSTLIGKLLYELGQISEDKVSEIKKSCLSRSVSFEWAFLLDSLKLERDQGVTVDTTQIFFRTKKRHYVFIDTPGHKEFLKNMITGATQAEIALLMIDVTEGIRDQTKKHVYLLRLIGMKKVIILINKMDAVDYKQKRFFEVKKKIENYLNDIDIFPVDILPISAKRGANITENDKIKWFKGNTVASVLDKVESDEKNQNSLLRFPVQDVYRIGKKRIIVGRIESGFIKEGDKILISPSNMESEINSIEIWPRKMKEKYFAGECVGITFKDQLFVEKGNIISKKRNPPMVLQTFRSKIFWFSKEPLSLNKNYQLKINTRSYEIKFLSIEKVIRTDNLLEKEKKIIERNDVSFVRIFSQSLICIDDFETLPNTGCFSISNSFEVVGGGIVDTKNDLVKKNDLNKPFLKSEEFFISEIDRVLRYGHRPGIIWLTGLSGSGKSTLAKEVEKNLFSKGYNTFILDGDNLRGGINKDLGFSPEDRKENIRRTAELAALISSAGFIVLVSLISPYRSDRNEARSIKPEIFKEVYVQASVKECERRDVKGLYSKAKHGFIKNFTGINAPYEKPNKPDLIINTEKQTILESSNNLTNFIEKEFSKI